MNCLRLLHRNINRFCFFKQQISQKYGKKCCRYNQNGIPLGSEKVHQTYTSLQSFLKGWKLSEDSKKLQQHYYVEDYPLALKFIEEIVKIDAHEFKQCPTYKVEEGELLSLELYSIPLKGLSMIDFQFAMRINNLPFEKFSLIPIANKQDYKFEISMLKMERQAATISKELDQDIKNWSK